MRLYIDVDDDTVIRSPGTPQQLDDFDIRRADQARLDVVFIKASQVIELPEGTTGRFELKPAGKYDAQPVTGASSWEQNGSGPDTFYSFFFSLTTTELDNLLQVDLDENNDVASLKMMGEIMWTEGGVSQHRTQKLNVTITNNVIRPGDTIPPEAESFDYMIDNSDPMNPVVLLDEDSLEPLTAG